MVGAVITYEGGTMANLDNALQQLREERSQSQLQIKKLDSAISVLEGLVGGNSSRVMRNNAQPSRVVSAAARRRMARAQRARWAKVRKQSESAQAGKPATSPAKRTLSATARRKIAAAQRARWARVRAEQKKAA